MGCWGDGVVLFVAQQRVLLAFPVGWTSTCEGPEGESRREEKDICGGGGW